MSAALHGTNPKDVIACFGFEERFGAFESFLHCLGSLFLRDFPACGDVKYGGDVAANLLLVPYDFRLAHFHFAVNENLISPRIGHHCTVETQEVVYALRYGLVLEAFLEDVRVRYDRFEAESVFELFRRNQLDVGVYDGKQKRSFHCAAFGFELADSAEQVFVFYLETQRVNLNQDTMHAYKKC